MCIRDRWRSRDPSTLSEYGCAVITVLLADDRHLVRGALAALLSWSKTRRPDSWSTRFAGWPAASESWTRRWRRPPRRWTQPVDRARARRAGRRPRRRDGERHRRPVVPLRGHGAQLPVLGDCQARGPQPGGGAAHGGGPGLAVAVTFGVTRPGCTPCRFSSPAHEPVEQVRDYIVTGTDMRAAIAAERHDLAAVLRHRVRLCAHRRLIRSSDGWERAVALEPESVAQFCAEVMAARRELHRDQRGTLDSRHRPGTIRAPGGVDGANVAGRTRVRRAYSWCQALRSPKPRRVSSGGRSG